MQGYAYLFIYLFIYCPKHRLWVLVRTDSGTGTSNVTIHHLHAVNNQITAVKPSENAGVREPSSVKNFSGPPNGQISKGTYMVTDGLGLNRIKFIPVVEVGVTVLRCLYRNMDAVDCPATFGKKIHLSWKPATVSAKRWPVGNLIAFGASTSQIASTTF